MKIAVIYTSKHGTTYSIANHIALALNAEVFALDEFDTDVLATYETIVLGSPVYNGKLQGDMELFCRQHMDTLLSKQLALFISGLNDTEHAQQHQVKSAFLKPLASHARSVVFVGGAIKTDKLSTLEKILTRTLLKVNKDTTKIDQAAIEALIDSVRND